MLDQLLQRMFNALMNCSDESLVYMLAVAVASFALLFSVILLAGRGREATKIRSDIARLREDVIWMMRSLESHVDAVANLVLKEGERLDSVANTLLEQKHKDKQDK